MRYARRRKRSSIQGMRSRATWKRAAESGMWLLKVRLEMSYVMLQADEPKDHGNNMAGSQCEMCTVGW
jgi:hypothetical protein